MYRENDIRALNSTNDLLEKKRHFPNNNLILFVAHLVSLSFDIKYSKVKFFGNNYLLRYHRYSLTIACYFIVDLASHNYYVMLNQVMTTSSITKSRLKFLTDTHEMHPNVSSNWSWEKSIFLINELFTFSLKINSSNSLHIETLSFTQGFNITLNTSQAITFHAFSRWDAPVIERISKWNQRKVKACQWRKQNSQARRSRTVIVSNI